MNKKITAATRFQTGLAVTLLTVLLALPGCLTTGSFSKFDYSGSVGEIFQSGQILPDHNYFYIGPDAEPVAIIALDKKYILAPSFWKPIELTPEKLAFWNYRIDNRYRFRNYYRGAVMFDAQGNRLGLWYSYMHWTRVKRGEGNTVIIHTPDITREMHKEGDRGVIWGALK